MKRNPVIVIVVILVMVFALASCNQSTPQVGIMPQAAWVGRATLTTGARPYLQVSPERMYPTGAFYGRCRIGNNIVRCGGYYIQSSTLQFHTEWQNGFMDGNYDATTQQITGNIKIGTRTGTFYLQ